MYRGRKVVAVIPSRNEARFIGRTIHTLPAEIDDVVVIDDASDDDTAGAARGSGDPRVAVITLPHNRGVGGAIVAGYRAALARRAALVLVTNGDGQMNGREALALLAPLVDGHADLVKGNRLRCPGTRDSIPAGRRAGIRLFSALTRLATGYDVGDAQSGYHALTAAALRRLPLESLWPRWGFPNDLLMKAAAAGLRVQERPVRAIYGDEVSALHPWHAVHPVGTLLLRGVARRWRR
ncbi:MAG: glycosyltransferase family 2 protein [Deltaproteobacteria bacterium]|nr:glycosyltransferase family 2 protein [Deltaproteobacteria bacterium]